MSGKFWLRLGMTLLLIAGLVALGVFVFNLGVARGTALGAHWADMPGPQAEMRPYGFHGFFGFGLLALGLPLLLAFMFFGAMRRLMFMRWMAGGPRHWHGAQHWGGPGHHGEGPEHIPPFVEEWHRKMHENQPPAVDAPENKG